MKSSNAVTLALVIALSFAIAARLVLALMPLWLAIDAGEPWAWGLVLGGAVGTYVTWWVVSGRAR